MSTNPHLDSVGLTALKHIAQRDAPPTGQLVVLETKMDAQVEPHNIGVIAHKDHDLTGQLRMAIRLGQPLGKLVVHHLKRPPQ